MSTETVPFEKTVAVILEESSDPMTLADLAKSLGRTNQTEATEVKAEVDEAIAAGRAFAVAPPPKGRSLRYSARDPIAESKDKLLAVVAESPKPLAPAEVLKKLQEMPGVVYPPTIERLQKYLAERVVANELFEHPIGRGGKKRGYAAEPYVSPEDELATKLTKVLESQRRIDAYPLTKKNWAELTETTTTNATFRKVSAGGTKLRQSVEILGRSDNALVFSLEDFGRIASQALLEILVRATRTKSSPFTTIERMAKKVPVERRDEFERAIASAKSQDRLSPQVGWFKDGKFEKFFLVDDLGSPAMRRRLLEPSEKKSSPNPTAAHELPAVAQSPASEFGREFAAVFERLDRASGNLNFVSLVELRRALPNYSKAAFDEGVQQLRRANRFSLRRPEGRHGITPEEHTASIFEAGSQFLFVERN